MAISEYKRIAIEARKKVLEMIYKAQTSHIGSNFSCLDLLTVLFEKADLDKDKIILIKGWAAASLYYFLWRKGRITKEELDVIKVITFDIDGVIVPTGTKIQEIIDEDSIDLYMESKNHLCFIKIK